MPLSTEAVEETDLQDAEPLDPSTMDWTCSRCGETKPLAMFSFTSTKRGKAPGWCRSCTNEVRRQSYDRKRSAAVGDLQRAIGPNVPASRVEVLVADVARRLGGIHRVAELLAEHIIAPRGRRERLSALRLMLRLIDASDELRSARRSSYDASGS
jgi:hypothetical protein